jgi:putative DNA primase/helicase
MSTTQSPFAGKSFEDLRTELRQRYWAEDPEFVYALFKLDDASIAALPVIDDPKESEEGNEMEATHEIIQPVRTPAERLESEIWSHEQRIKKEAAKSHPNEAYVSRLEALVEKARTASNPADGLAVFAYASGQKPEKVKPVVSASLKRMSGVKTKKVTWLWDKTVALGKLTLYVGDPDGGKSLATTDLAARLSVGATMPDGSQSEPCEVLMLIGEDDPEDTTAPRLQAAGADLDKIYFLPFVVETTGGVAEEIEVAIDRHLKYIKGLLVENPAIRLVVIDPVSNYLGEAKMTDEKDIRQKVLTPLKRLAAEMNVAVLGVMHLNKKTELAAINRVGGAMGFVGVARMVWMFVRDTDNPDQSYMLQVKSNLAKRREGYQFRIDVKPVVIEGDNVEQPIIDWQGDASVSVNDKLTSNRKGGDKSERDAGSSTAKWLRRFLLDGPKAVSEVVAAAVEEQAVTRRTLFRAKAECGRRALDLEPNWWPIETETRAGVAFWCLDRKVSAPSATLADPDPTDTGEDEPF